MTCYVLSGRKAVIEPDALRFALWMIATNRSIARTELERGVVVGTVFLGVDHGDGFERAPLLFETRILGTTIGGQSTWRWSTWIQAMKGHAWAVNELAVPAPRDDAGE